MANFIQDLSLLWIIGIFVLSAALVWRAGVKLSEYADKILEKTDVSEVFIGTLGLAVITSLPELATTISATLVDNVSLAVNNLFGAAVLQITILAVGDAIIKGNSLSGSLENPVSRFQAICLSFLLSVAAIAILYEDVPVFHVGVWSIVIFVLFIALFYVINYFKRMKWWLTKPKERESIGKVKAIVSKRMEEIEEEENQEEGESEEEDNGEKKKLSEVLMSRVGFFSLLAAVGILIGGYFVANSADIIAERTGLGSSFMGFLFVGFTSALPELSTTISAAKLKRYRMAFSNVFGTTILNVSMVFLVDLIHTEGPVLNEIGDFAAVGAILGILLTNIYLIGLTIKLKKTFFRLGFDSILVVLFYVIGIFILFNMREV